ncbi:MAG: teichoic acid biosynthesis protein TagF [Lachnospiraceae bacterium]|nr:teichoic acid biosynthesis protein TagF [Lachnospiraceae bacterium]
MSDFLKQVEEDQVEGKVLYAKVRKNKLFYRICVPTIMDEGVSYSGLKLSYDTKREADFEEYIFDIRLVRKNSKRTIYESVIQFDEISLKPLNWVFTVTVTDGAREAAMQLYNRSYLNYAKYCSIFFDNSYCYGNGMFVYPYVNGARKIVLQYRMRGEYDDYRIKLKERLAALRFCATFPYLKSKRICLVYEKYSQMAQDNGYYFFKYCMDNSMEKVMGCKIFYVITKNSPDRDKLISYQKNVLDFMTIRHITYALAAKLLISTDAKAHVYPWRRKGSALVPFIKKKKLVFLQHGVTAMKKVDFFYGKGKSGQCDLFIVTSDFEKKIVFNNFGYSEHQIPVTGFARWDVLRDKSGRSNKILIMPTWRSWLEDCTEEQFKESNYYRNYYDLLNNESFHDLLKRYDLEADFYLHTKFRNYIGEFSIESDRVKILEFGEIPLNELMMKSRMLVTDYSSTAWDMFYQRKPVLFYQFDLQDYLQVHGSYINMECDLFGSTAKNTEELLKHLEQCIKSGFSLSEQQKEQYNYYFKYVDDKNSQRICEAIMKELL